MLALALIILSGCEQKKGTDFLSEAEEGLLKERLVDATQRYKRLVEQFGKKETIPYTYINSQVSGVDPVSWTSGFFPGSLWYLYEYTGENFWKEQAGEFTSKLKEQQFNKATHDLGFMMYCSYGNGYRLTNDPEYKQILIRSAESLCSRYSPKTGLIRSWDFGGWWKEYPVIIDNMMNLELILWASSVTDDSLFKQIAVSHSLNTMKAHYRPDKSCYHVVDFDSISGKSLNKGTLQGFSDSSSWARGQAWGLYGFTFMYRETGDSIFLKHAEEIADYILSQADNEDPVPCWDYSVANIPGEEKDASAGSVIASALLEIYSLTNNPRYINASKKLLLALSGPEYFASDGENGGFLLKHSVANKPAGEGIDVPLNYADYYYLEAVIKMLNLENGRG